MPHPASLLRNWSFVVAVLAGCQSAPSAPPALPGAASAAAARSTLIDEQRRLAALFLGTPVVFELQSSSVLRVDVPLRFCFDPGDAAVKPALAAVLDRLAQSQRDGSSRIEIGTSADGPTRPASAATTPGRAALAGRRAAAVRDRLVSQGLPAVRLAVVDGEAAGLVRLVVTEAPAP